MHYYHLHIPKTGGTTLNKVLNQIYKKSSILNHYRVVNNGINNNNLLSKKIKIINGHYSFGLHKDFNDAEFTYFAMLRNPINRVVSHYLHAKNRKNHYLYEVVNRENISLIDYVSSGICQEVNNGMSKQIAGLYVNENFTFPNEKSEDYSDNELFHKAINNINNYFSFIGILERFDESLVLLKEIFPSRPVNYKYKIINKSKGKKYIISNQEREIIEKYNQCDIRLYKVCIDQFEKRLKEFNSEEIDFRSNFIESKYLQLRRKVNTYF